MSDSGFRLAPDARHCTVRFVCEAWFGATKYISDPDAVSAHEAARLLTRLGHAATPALAEALVARRCVVPVARLLFEILGDGPEVAPGADVRRSWLDYLVERARYRPVEYVSPAFDDARPFVVRSTTRVTSHGDDIYWNVDDGWCDAFRATQFAPGAAVHSEMLAIFGPYTFDNV